MKRRPVLALALAAALFLGAAPASAATGSGLLYASKSKQVETGNPLEAFTLDVPCPAGTVALGGGWSGDFNVVAEDGSHPAPATANAWQIEFRNVAEGAGTETITGYASCADAAALPAGSLSYPKGSLKLKPWPLKPRSGVVKATCPPGSVAVAGGPSVAEPREANVGFAGSYPAWAAQGNTTGRSWEVAGKAGLAGETIYSSAVCLKSALAFGVFHLNAASREKLVWTATQKMSASCPSGEAISGGFAAFNKKGTKPFYSGGSEAETFTSAGSGYELKYSTSGIYRKKLRAYAICGEIQAPIATLTQADLDAACQAALPDGSGVHAVPGRLATDWRCAGEDAASVPIPGNQGAWACAAARGSFAPTAIYLRRGDPLSWVCYGRPEGAQPATAVGGTARLGTGSRAQVQVSGRTRIRKPVGDLSEARVTVPSTLLEATGAGDLVRDSSSGPVHPVVLTPRGRKGRDFVFAGGSEPRMSLSLRISGNRRAIVFRLRSRGGRLGKPQLCDSGPAATTQLTTRLLIDSGELQPTDVLARAYWGCGSTRLTTTKPALLVP